MSVFCLLIILLYSGRFWASAKSLWAPRGGVTPSQRAGCSARSGGQMPPLCHAPRLLIWSHKSPFSSVRYKAAVFSRMRTGCVMCMFSSDPLLLSVLWVQLWCVCSYDQCVLVVWREQRWVTCKKTGSLHSFKIWQLGIFPQDYSELCGVSCVFICVLGCKRCETIRK